MRDRQIGILPVNRNGLPDLLQGLRPEQTMRLCDFHEEFLNFERDALYAVWERENGDQLSALPALLLGSEPLLRDALAWSASFLNGLGPLSGIVRIMTFDEFQQSIAVEQTQVVPPPTALNRAVALILGELSARLGEEFDESRLTISAALNTLSYVLFRSALISPKTPASEIYRRWREIAHTSSSRQSERVSALALEMVQQVIFSQSFQIPGSTNQSYNENAELEFEDKVSIDKIGYNVPSSVKRLLPETFWYDASSLTSEEAVRLADDIIPVLTRLKDVSARDKSAIVARVASLANSDLSNQTELVKRSLSDLPEIALWLGYNFGVNEVGRVRSINNGIGWKLAARISARLDMFAIPTCDISWREMSLLPNLGSQRRRSATLQRRSVEIVAGLNLIASAENAVAKENDVTLSSKTRRNLSRTNEADDLMAAAERSLLEAMRAVQALKYDRRLL